MTGSSFSAFDNDAYPCIKSFFSPLECSWWCKRGISRISPNTFSNDNRICLHREFLFGSAGRSSKQIACDIFHDQDGIRISNDLIGIWVPPLGPPYRSQDTHFPIINSCLTERVSKHFLWIFMDILYRFWGVPIEKRQLGIIACAFSFRKSPVLCTGV